MATPANRVPVRIARGTKANLDTAMGAGDLKEGEICYASDENGVYVVEGGVLTKAGADLTTSSIGALSDVDTTTTPPTTGQTLVWDVGNSSFVPGYAGASLEAAPPSATSTGTAGELRFDTDYLYLAVATDTWKRTALSTWTSEGVNDLTAATGGVLNYLAEYTGNGTTQTFVTDSELSFVHIGSQGAVDYNEGGALYWNLDGHTADFPIGYMKNIEGNFSDFEAPNASRLSFDASGFTVGSSNRTNANTALNVAVGFRKDGTKTLTNSSGPDSTVYLAADAGVQVIQWEATGSGSDVVYHGMNGAPEIMFWTFSDYDNSGGNGQGAWYYNGSVYENVTGVGADAHGTWRLDGAAVTNSDLQMSYTATTFTSCSNTYFEFNGTGGVFTAIAFKSTPGVVDVGVCAGAGGSVLSTDCGFRPKLVWFKPQDADTQWQQKLDNTSATGNTWGSGLGDDWGIATDITITATGFDLPDGVDGNNGTVEGIYVAVG